MEKPNFITIEHFNVTENILLMKVYYGNNKREIIHNSATIFRPAFTKHNTLENVIW